MNIIAANGMMIWVAGYSAAFALIIGSGLIYSWYVTRKKVKK